MAPRRRQHTDAPEAQPRPVTPAQRAHVRAVAQRLRLVVDARRLHDRAWVDHVLAVFSYHAETRSGGFAALRILVLRHLEGCPDDHIARVLDVPVQAVVTAIRLLEDSGYRLAPPEEDPGPDDGADDEDPAEATRPHERRDAALLLRLCDGAEAAPEPGDERTPLPAPPTPRRPPAPSARRALSFLGMADIATRLRWAQRATARGVPLPPAATARENLHLWVEALADEIVHEEGLDRP